MDSPAAADAGRADAGLRRLSVVIPNFNDGRFLAQAIDSELALGWPDVEVIVVDDGSTDDSRDVIERHGPRIRGHFQPNRGQLEACNAGFEMSSGEAVLFLDADDVVSPDAARALHAVWHPKVGKVQLQMRAVDARGPHVGAFVPHFRFTISPRDVPGWVLTTLTCPASPGSGYACSRWFLDRLFAPSEVANRYGANSCATATPLPMASCRVDGASTGAMTERDPSRLGRGIQHAIERHRDGNTHGRPQRRRIAPDAWRTHQPANANPARQLRRLLAA